MYYILRLINIFFTLIPRKIGLILGRSLGFLLYHFIPIRKKIAKKNILLSFPDLTNPACEKMIKDCYKHFGMVLIDFLRMPLLNKKNIKNILPLNDETINLLKSINGGIIMSGHLGNWEMFIPAFGLNNFAMSIITQTQKSKGGEQFFNWIRKKENINLIPKKEPKETMQQALIDNKFLGLVSDQNAGKNGIEVPFFNTMVSIAKGAGYFHIKTKKPILVGFCILTPQFKYKLTLKKIDENIINDDKNDLIYNVNQYFSSLLEEEIKKYPEQYFWFHKKWDKKIYK